MVRPLILDGGLATSLEERGHRLHPRLWSAGVFISEPQAVEELHLAFIEAGAEILISASYQMSFEGLQREGLSREASADAMCRTVTTARRAAERAGRPDVTIAASIGPYGATLCDGSEYRGGYGVPYGIGRFWIKPRMPDSTKQVSNVVGGNQQDPGHENHEADQVHQSLFFGRYPPATAHPLQQNEDHAAPVQHGNRKNVQYGQVDA